MHNAKDVNAQRTSGQQQLAMYAATNVMCNVVNPTMYGLASPM